MLDLIYSSSILIDSCRCLPAQKKKKKYYFYHYYWRIIDFFWKPKNIEGNFRFPTVLSYEEDGCTLILIPLLSAHWGGSVCFLSLLCIIMASRRALLVVYLVSLVYVRSAKCLGREEGDVGMGGEVGLTTQATQPWSFFIFSHQGKIVHQSPPTLTHPTPPKPITRTWGWAEPGKNTLLFDQVFKITKKEKEKKQLL